MWNLIKKAAGFVKETIKVAVRTIIDTIKDIARNIIGVAILIGSTIGYTLLWTNSVIMAAAPAWINPVMIAPVLGITTVMILVAGMNIQLSLEGII